MSTFTRITVWFALIAASLLGALCIFGHEYLLGVLSILCSATGFNAYVARLNLSLRASR